MRNARSKLIVLAFVFLLHGPAIHGATPRVRFTINDGWYFSGSALADGQRNAIDVSSWQKISLPHTWNIADTLDDEPGYRRGVGWYRKDLLLPEDLHGNRIFLYFEGANQTAEVFVNERSAGTHIGGYTAFAFDITGLVKFDAPNHLAVRVDNSHNSDIPPLDADFNMHGGIYRDVWLVAVSDLHIKVADMASAGIVIRTPKVSGSLAEVSIAGTIVNAAERPREFEVISTIADANGRVAGTSRWAGRAQAGSEADFSGETIRLRGPKLWSPDEPYLYRVRTVIRENGKDIDEVTEPLGLRWYRFDANDGFFLNGKPLKLRGTNRHQDRKGYGNAVPDELQVRDLETIKETGFNFVRLAHYPQDPSVLAAADRLGLMLWEEIPIVNRVAISEAFNGNAEMMLREMIRQHRNHPSVILWGFMNEVFLQAPKNERQTQATVDLAKALQRIAREEDPGRMTAIAFDRGDADDRYHRSGLGQVTDVVGWNLYHGWYYGTFDDFGKFLDEQHRRFPDRPLFVSEYGANADRRVHSLEPKRFDSTPEWQRMYHESYLQQINVRKFVSGGAVWNMFDFSSEFRGDTMPHINQKGLYTYDRKPKDAAWIYRANSLASPVLYLAVRDWPVRSGQSQQSVDVYSNADMVKLFANGRSLGKKRPSAPGRFTWKVAFRRGSNILSARGIKGGISVTDEAKVMWIDPDDMADIAINAGSNAEYVHQTGSLWQADRAYVSGKWGYVGGNSKEVVNLRNILGTDQDAVAQTAREGSFAYRFDVADGEYDVELWFTELKPAKPGDRIFEVRINDARAIGSLDLAKEAGPFTVLARRFRVSARSRGGIRIDLRPVIGQPIISGLRVRRII